MFHKKLSISTFVLNKKPPQLSALITRRRQLVDMRTAEKNRLSSCPPSIRQEIEAHLEWLEEKIEQLNQEIEQLTQKSQAWQQRMDLLRSVPGVGPVIASTLVAELPELGQLTGKQISRYLRQKPLLPTESVSGFRKLGRSRRWKVLACLEKEPQLPTPLPVFLLLGCSLASDRSRNCGFIRAIIIRLALVAIAVHLPSLTFIVRWA